MSKPHNNGRQTGGRFAPGNALGRGRNTGSRNRASLLLDKMADGEAPAVLSAVLDAAKAGDARCAEIVLARVWPVRKGRPVSLTLPEMIDAAGVSLAIGEVAKAVAAGELTTDEGQSIAAILDVRRRSLELVEIEARLAALEARGVTENRT